jgi:hypothetical protein
MSSTIVKLNFLDTTVTPNKSYDFPLVQDIQEPVPGTKSVVIEGNRADGAIVIPGGKKSIEIIIKGILFDKDGFIDLETSMGTINTDITTNPATLTLSHWTGSTWATDWVKSVRRTEAIEFGESMRTQDINYTVRFLVISY